MMRIMKVTRRPAQMGPEKNPTQSKASPKTTVSLIGVKKGWICGREFKIDIIKI